MTTTPADQVRKETERAATRQATARAAQQRKDAANARKSEVAARASAKKDLSAILAAVHKAASKNEHSYHHEVFHWSNSSWSAYDRAYTHELIKLLVAKGFKAETGSYREDPFGSDSLFDTPVYDGWVAVSW
jgi:uncharacterized protein (DUF885 family)